MKKLFLCFFIFNSFFSSAQNPLVKMWDKRFGGTNNDELACFKNTIDGGYILGGTSYSDSIGDKTRRLWNPGYADFWIVKIDSRGVKQWDKDFGGMDNDYLTSIWQTFDGGYILGGYSFSGIGGDKTEANRHSFASTTDYWVIKIDSLGNKQWDKTFGGTDYDYLYSLQQTSDSGYVLGGLSFSSINGDKTEDTKGWCDFWIIKTDSLGNKLWDKDFGGSSFEDAFASVIQTQDGGYLLGGFSKSNISGDKTENSWGGYDYWIIKTDSSGIKLWDRDFGGSNDDRPYSLIQSSDNGYLLAGWSESGASGNKSVSNWGYKDYWIIKIDSLGTMIWERDYGGTGEEQTFGIVSQTNDTGFLLCGTSYSNISGDKTENNLGATQVWIVKTDSSGIKRWDKTVFTIPDQKGIAFCIQNSNGCYAIAKPTFAGIGGEKTELNWDTSYSSTDYWIVTFCDSNFLPMAAIAAPFSICQGSCASFTNLSVNATTFLWNFSGGNPDTSSSANPTNICYANPGSYDVQLIVTNSIGSDTLLIANYLTIFPISSQSISFVNDTLFALPGAATYQWYFNTLLINGATNYFYLATQNGDYNVTATDSNGCESEAVIYDIVTSEPSLANGTWSMSPNPIQDELKIMNDQLTIGSAIQVSIYNALGEKVNPALNNFRTSNGILTVDCRPLSPGIYFVKAFAGEKVLFGKLVKE